MSGIEIGIKNGTANFEVEMKNVGLHMDGSFLNVKLGPEDYAEIDAVIRSYIRSTIVDFMKRDIWSVLSREFTSTSDLSTFYKNEIADILVASVESLHNDLLKAVETAASELEDSTKKQIQQILDASIKEEQIEAIFDATAPKDATRPYSAPKSNKKPGRPPKKKKIS